MERVTSDSSYHLTERAYGAFQRTFPLPRGVDWDKARAKYDNGVMTVRMPKLAGQAGKTLPVA